MASFRRVSSAPYSRMWTSMRALMTRALRLVAGGAHGGQPFGLRLGVDQPAVAVVVCVFQVAANGSSRDQPLTSSPGSGNSPLRCQL